MVAVYVDARIHGADNFDVQQVLLMFESRQAFDDWFNVANIKGLVDSRER